MPQSGYLLIDKPAGQTSSDVVDELQRITKIRRIGHAGTLDPIVSGLLIMGVSSEATVNLGKFQRLDKKYRAILRLGFISDTYDRTGIIQREKVRLKPQEAKIYDIKLQAMSSKLLTLDVHCSSDTYIRALTDDIGKRLECGAYVEELTRTAIGNFELAEAVSLSHLDVSTWAEHLITFKTVMATGTFEIFHPGHAYYLKEAKKLGKRLIVVVARDKRAEELRGRPLRHGENTRLKLLQSLPYVDEATLGDVDDPYKSVQRIKPDIIALGYDQRGFTDQLGVKIKEFGLATKIARIPAFFPKRYKSSLM